MVLEIGQLQVSLLVDVLAQVHPWGDVAVALCSSPCKGKKTKCRLCMRSLIYLLCC